MIFTWVLLDGALQPCETLLTRQRIELLRKRTSRGSSPENESCDGHDDQQDRAKRRDSVERHRSAAAQYVMIDERLRFSISSNIAMVNRRL